MNNNIQCSIESSTTKIELNSAVDGVFLVPELDGLAGLPEIRTTSGVNAGYDGGWTSAQNYDARLISIRGVIANPDISKVEDKRRAIASLLGQGRKEQLTLRFTTEAGNAYAISVRTISCEMALQRVLTTQEFLIQLRADDPLIYDDGTTGGIAAILQPQRALGGFEINFGLPLAIGGGAEDTVVDNGNETVYPVIKLYGALHSPTVVNRTTNQQMQILADLQYSIDWHTYRSATGDYILVSDGLNGAPMTLSQLTGNATQQTYSGKNLYNYASISTVLNGTNNGDGTVTSITWSSGAWASTTVNFSSTSIEQEFTLSMDIRLTSGSTGTFSKINDGVADFVQVEKPTISTTWQRFAYKKTPSSGYTMTKFFVQFTAINGSFEIRNVQIEKSSTPSAYEPYVGGTASPNPDYPQPISTVTGEQNIEVSGKNLFDMDDFLTTAGATYTKDGDQYSITAWGNLISTRYPLQGIKTGNTYTISLSGVAQNTANARLQVYKNGSAVGTIYGGTDHQEHSYTFTADGSQYAVNAAYSSPFSSPVIFKNPQLERGSATTYESYHGQEFPIDLGSIELAKIGTYQDRIYKEDSKWYIEKQVGKVVLDGSEQYWAYVSGAHPRFTVNISSIKPAATAGTVGDVMSDYFTTTSASAIYSGTDNGIAVHNEQAQLWFSYFAITSLADFKTWLSTHPTTVYYALATPTTTEITDATLLSQLNFIASLYEGVNNISIVGTGAQGEMTVRYATDYTVNQDIITIDSQARTITLNGQDVYHLKTSESEFLVLAPGENKLYLTSEVSDDSGYAEVKFKQGYLSI